MEQNIIETANKYKAMAQALYELEPEHVFDKDVPEDVQAALIRLYYAKAFEAEIEKCQDLLDEDTDEDTVEAVFEASATVEAASESAFSDIQAYAQEDAAFARTIEGISASSDIEGLKGLLYKLYKCEGIIRAAQRCSMRFPIYGMPKGQSVVEQGIDVMDEMESIEQNVGIDVNSLLELRESLVGSIGALIGKGGSFQ